MREPIIDEVYEMIVNGAGDIEIVEYLQSKGDYTWGDIKAIIKMAKWDAL